MDRWDAIAIIGISLVTFGVGCVYWPAGFVTAGGFLLLAYYIRERSIHVPRTRIDRDRGEQSADI